MKAFKVKKLYDGTGAAPLENAVLLTDGSRIADIIAAGETEKELKYAEYLAPGAVEDCSNLYVMPGLIDCHVHLMLPGDGTAGEDIVPVETEGEITVRAFRNAMTALRNGVTTIRDNGGAYYAAISVRNAFERQGINGPDIVACGAPLTCTGGHCWYMGGECDGADGIRRKIREQQKHGADFVKIMAAYGGTRGITKTLTFSDYELQTAIDEARLRGMKVVAHSTIYEATRKLAEMGPDTIAHTVMCDAACTRNYLDEELVAMLVEKHIYADHTLCAVKEAVRRAEEKIKAGTATAAEITANNANKAYDELTEESFRFQRERGVAYVIGTDAGWRLAPFEGAFYENLSVTANCGAPSEELIVASTGRAAESLGLEKKLGTLKAGMQADILFLDKDPGKDIAKAVKKPVHIMKRGKMVEV